MIGDLQRQLEAIEEIDAGRELLTVPESFTEVVDVSPDDDISSCFVADITEDECGGVLDACEEPCLDEVTRGEDLLTFSSAEDELEGEDTLFISDKELCRYDCPVVIVGSYIDPYSSLLQASTKIFLC